MKVKTLPHCCPSSQKLLLTYQRPLNPKKIRMKFLLVDISLFRHRRFQHVSFILLRSQKSYNNNDQITLNIKCIFGGKNCSPVISDVATLSIPLFPDMDHTLNVFLYIFAYFCLSYLYFICICHNLSLKADGVNRTVMKKKISHASKADSPSTY